LYEDINGLDPVKSVTTLRDLEKQIQKLIGTENDAISTNEKYGKSFREFLRNNPDLVKQAIKGNTEAILKLQDAQMDGAIQDGWLNSFKGLKDEVEAAGTSLDKVGGSL